MDIHLTYEEALRRHPKEVQEVLQDIRKSRSKEKNTPPEKFTWSYSWAFSALSFSMAQLLSGNAPKETRTVEERICGPRLAATRKLLRRCSSVIRPIPQEVLDYHKPSPVEPFPENTPLPPGLVLVMVEKP